MTLLGQGMSSAGAAAKYGRAVKTVEWHRVSLGTKLGIRNRAELTRLAIEEGLVPVRFRRQDDLELRGDFVAGECDQRSCEGCRKPATTQDVDGVPLCEACAGALKSVGG